MKNTLFILLMLASFVLAACGADGSSKNEGGAAAPGSVPAEFSGKTNPFGLEAAEAGAVMFNNNCVACHGPQGRGDGPAGTALDPAPKNLPELSATVGDDYLFWRISAGSEGTSMPAWKGVLTDEQIWQVIAYIRTLK
jgi:mono/diheme cytochrome c family protein